MKRTQKFAVGLVASLGLGLAAAAHAHPGRMDGGTEHGARSGSQHGMHGGMDHGRMGGERHGASSGAAGENAHQHSMTPAERTAIREKMRDAATPEERQQIAAAMRAEMSKRAVEKGNTVPEGRGPGAGSGAHAGSGPHGHRH